MVFHTVEEYVTKLWNFDPFIISVSHQFQVSPVSFYLGLQALGLLLISVVLVLTIKNRFNLFLGLLLGLVFLLELSHLYSSIKIWNYYSGLYTGIALIVIGYFYWRELIKQLQRK